MSPHFFDFSGLEDHAWGLFLVITIFSATFGKNDLFRFLQIPVITGYMLMGFLCGPYVAGLMNKTQVSELGYINHAALSFIAFSAGAEIYIPEIMPLIKPILWVSGFMIFFTMLIGTAFTYGVGGTSLLPWLEGYTSCNFGVAMLIATILAARSPTSVLAVVRELKAAGYVTSVMIGITVAGDVFVLTIFAIVQAMTINFCSGGAFDPATFIVNLVMIPAAIFWGYLLGWVLVGLLYIQHGKHLILPIGFFTYLICDYILAASEDQTAFEINVDALLICITAGFVAGNSPKRDELVEYFHELSMYIFIPFFTQVGLQLNLPVLINSLGFSIVASLVRAFCMFLGTVSGGHVVQMPQDKSLRLWMGLLPQAGVALGLAGIIGQQFKDSFGNSFQSTVLGVILVNQVIGPVFAKVLIKYCHEDGQADGTEALHNMTKAMNDGFMIDHGKPKPADTQTEERCFELLLVDDGPEDEGDAELGEAGNQEGNGSPDEEGQTFSPLIASAKKAGSTHGDNNSDEGQGGGEDQREGGEGMHKRTHTRPDGYAAAEADVDMEHEHEQDPHHAHAHDTDNADSDQQGVEMTSPHSNAQGFGRLAITPSGRISRRKYTPGGIRIVDLSQEGKAPVVRDTAVITLTENTLLHTVIHGYTKLKNDMAVNSSHHAPLEPGEGDQAENPMWWTRFSRKN